MNKYTLCWDCAKATGTMDCQWANAGKPVRGWHAEKVEKTVSRPYSTYCIYRCPKFIRDSYYGGTVKLDGRKCRRERFDSEIQIGGRA